jgi:hypothetical protein
MAYSTAILGVLVLALSACNSGSVPEHEVDQISAPDGSFVIIITRTQEHFPYGVEGNLYIAEPDGTNRRFIDDYLTDDHGELLAYIEWDSEEQAFRYTGKGSPILIRPN